MLKKIIYGFLLAAACTLPVLTTEAANWIKVGETDDSTSHYIDTDSYSYDKTDNIGKCWVKVIFPDKNESVLGYEFFNFTDRTVGVKSSVSYKNGSVTDRNDSVYVDYSPVIPESILEKYYSILENFAFMENSKLNWEFNKQFVPDPSPIGSENWISMTEGPNAPVILVDKTSVQNTNDRYSSAWFLFDNNSFYSMQYNLAAKDSGKITIAKQIFYDKDNTKIMEVTYPALIWIIPDKTTPNESKAIETMGNLFAER